MDEGGMSIRLDPRRRDALKRLAAEGGMRPGELALLWLQERLDAEGRGPGTVSAPANEILADLREQVASLVRRVDALTAPPGEGEAAEAAAAPSVEPTTEPSVEPRSKKGGRARRKREKVAEPAVAPAAVGADEESEPEHDGSGKVALHQEIAAVLAERGPMRARELAEAIAERGHYQAPRSAKPLDAATVNSRVSNPHYRNLFVRRDGRIALADTD
jgi:hypothetical protein